MERGEKSKNMFLNRRVQNDASIKYAPTIYMQQFNVHAYTNAHYITDSIMILESKSTSRTVTHTTLKF